MDQADFKEFTSLLDGTCAMLSRGAYAPNPTSTALFFNTLRAHPLAVVKAAFTAHCQDPQRGRFAPVPADILAQIEGAAAADGRPGPEEAWAMCQTAADQARTMVWTDEMAQAWGVAWPVLHGGDEVGARMAFKEAYQRLIGAARKICSPVRWSATLGTDVQMRDDALRIAVDAGRLPLSALPPPEARPVGLIEFAQRRGVPDYIREKVASLRVAESPREAECRRRRERDARLKAAHRERMARAAEAGYDADQPAAHSERHAIQS